MGFDVLELVRIATSVVFFFLQKSLKPVLNDYFTTAVCVSVQNILSTMPSMRHGDAM